MTNFDPVGEWLAAFPDTAMTPAGAGLIDAEVKPGDETAWAMTIEKYIGNWNPAFPREYNPRKIGNVLGVFREFKQRLSNGADRQFNNSIGNTREARAFAERDRLEQARRLADRIGQS